MRAPLLMATLSAMCLAVSCAQDTPPPARASNPALTGQTNLPPRQGPEVGPPAPYPQVTPVTPVQGRVVFLNPKLRFVIVDFAFHRLPQFEQRLGVFRAGRRVGEVRISGPADGTRIAADVMSGEADVGDLVRED